MAIFEWLFGATPKAETRSETTETVSDLASVLQSGAGDISYITKRDAMNIPAVASAVRFVAGCVGSVPVRMYKRVGDDVVEVEDDYRLKLINDETGDLLDANQFKQALVSDIMLDGVGYAYLNTSRNKIKSVHYVDSGVVSVSDNNDHIFKQVRILVDGKDVPEYQMMRATRQTLDGVRGIGVLKQNPVLFRAMFNALKYESSTLSSGAKRGFLKSKFRLEQDALDKLREGWRKQSTNSEQNDVIVLNEGISFEPTASTATETQLQQNKISNSNLVYAMFGLPEMLFSNPSDEIYASAVKMGVLPVLSALEAAFNKFMLLEREKGTFFFRFDTSEVLKKSLLERTQSYEIALKNGWLQVDEIRKRENMPALGLDFVKLSLGDVLYNPATQEIYTANTNSTVKMGGDTPVTPAPEEENNEV